MAFSPFHTPSELRQHGSCMIQKTASITEHSITVVLAVPYTTTMGGETIIHILAQSTGKLVFYFPCYTRHSL